MRLMATITAEQMPKVYAHIQCDQWAEVFEEEYVFVNPSPAFKIMLALLDVVTYTDVPAEADLYTNETQAQ
jgi:hypothetical protein